MDFLQDKIPYESFTHKQDTSKQRPPRQTKQKLSVLGTTEEKISLRNRAFGAKPAPSETIHDIHDTAKRSMFAGRLKQDVTERTKRRRRRRELKFLEKERRMKESRRETVPQTKTKIKVELVAEPLKAEID